MWRGLVLVVQVLVLMLVLVLVVVVQVLVLVLVLLHRLVLGFPQPWRQLRSVGLQRGRIARHRKRAGVDARRIGAGREDVELRSTRHGCKPPSR